MSHLFGPIRQLGYVVRDIEAAMEHWAVHLGVGPWFYNARYEFNRFSYRGVRHDQLDISVAMANSGQMQIELIQQRCTTPSMYLDFLDEGSEGLQHLAFWPEDYDFAYRAALDAGYVVGQEGELPRGKFVYFESAGHPGTVFEFNEITPMRQAIIDKIRLAAEQWSEGEHVTAA
jgi:hypothetical protein